jgi:mannosyl-oligosaccharide alpha-1,2-mannosidase
LTDFHHAPQEFEEAVAWVAKELDVRVKSQVNTFETTIRVMGGLLSAYHYSKNQALLDKVCACVYVCIYVRM